jgi:hypothetical protein
VTIARFQKLKKAADFITWFACARAPRAPKGFRRPSMQDLTAAEETKKSS